MIKTRLAAALSFAFMAIPNANAAQYNVIELPVANKGLHSFPSAISDDGVVTVNVKTPYNIPIDISLLDFELESFTNNLTDVESAKLGNFNLTDYNFMLSVIYNNIGSQFFQQVADTTSYSTTLAETNFLPGFGMKNENGDYKLDTSTLVRDINNFSTSVGRSQGGFYNVPYTFENDVETHYVINDFSARAFAELNGSVIELPPTDITLGGVSDAFGINDNNQVVGSGSTSFESQALQASYDACISEEEQEGGGLLRGDVPVESCMASLSNQYISSVSSYAQTRGLIWQLDDQGNLLNTRVLGLLFTPETDDVNKYSSSAIAINNNGIAVGQASGKYVSGDTTVIRNYAVVFNGDDVVNITPDVELNIAFSATTLSTVTGINDNDLVIGYQPKRVNGITRNKFFVYDINANQLTSPNDFFKGSSSVALDINNHGIVVGYGEIEATQTTRRTGGFVYDHNTESFTGLTDVIGWDTPYKIVQANAINDNGEIAASALVQRPRRNALGDIVLDEDGNEIISDQVIVVKLEPIQGGTVDECDTSGVDPVNDRQGASIYWLLALGLLTVGYRRAKKLPK